MQPDQLPEVGKTYQSQAFPNVTVYVETLHLDDEEPDSFLVEACDPADKGDMSACGIEFDADEWKEHRFTPIPCK